MINSKLIATLFAILPTKNPKWELNHILFDDENIVACDTRFLIVIPNKTNYKGLLLNSKAKISIDKTIDNYLDEYGLWIRNSGFNYPEYRKIIRKTSEKTYFPKMLDILDAFEAVLFNRAGYIEAETMKHIEKISKILGREAVSFYYTNKSNPIQVNLENDAIVMAMPVISQYNEN